MMIQRRQCAGWRRGRPRVDRPTRLDPELLARSRRRETRQDAILDRLEQLFGREAVDLAYEYADLTYANTLELFGERPSAPMPPETPPGGFPSDHRF